MANGRAASVEPHSPLARAKLLAVAEVAGRAGASRILAAAELDEASFEALFADQIESRDETRFDAASGALRRRFSRRFGALTLGEQNWPLPPRRKTLPAGARRRRFRHRPAELEQGAKADARKGGFLRAIFARNAREGEENPWPDLSEAGLSGAETWLAPFIEGCQRLDEIGPEQFDAALAALLPWELSRKLDEQAPTHFVTPAGSSIALDYSSAEGPVLAARVQEFYGLSTHPSLANGLAPITLHLLSPAHRPIQITRDLPGFWKGSWASAKADMKGRYPRHLWPDDPASAAPTTRVKPRGT